MKRFNEEYKDKYEFEVLSGGMIFEESPRHIGAIASYIQGAYKGVEELWNKIWRRLPLAYFQS